MDSFNQKLASMSSASFALIAKGFVFLGESTRVLSDRLCKEPGMVPRSEFNPTNKGERSPSLEKQSVSRCGLLDGSHMRMNRTTDMINRTSILLASVLVILIGALAQPLKTTPAKEFMRAKLEHSQKVLEGIAVEDYRLILVHAQKLGAMSQDAEWKMFQNPEYLELSASFRRYADTLTQAAKEKNLDQATVAYLGMTMSCVECHKFVRGRRMARIETEVPSAPSLSDLQTRARDVFYPKGA